MSLKIIKNGTIVTTAETYSAEILINGEVIEAIGRDFERLHPEAEVIDAAGKYVFPGGIDPHVHLDLPMPGTVSSDDHYTRQPIPHPEVMSKPSLFYHGGIQKP